MAFYQKFIKVNTARRRADGRGGVEALDDDGGWVVSIAGQSHEGAAPEGEVRVHHGRHLRRLTIRPPSTFPRVLGRAFFARMQRARGDRARGVVVDGHAARAAREHLRTVSRVRRSHRRRRAAPTKPRARTPLRRPPPDLEGAVPGAKPRRHQHMRGRAGYMRRVLPGPHIEMRDVRGEPRPARHPAKARRPRHAHRRRRRRRQPQQKRAGPVLHDARRVRARHEGAHRAGGRPGGRRVVGDARGRDGVGARRGRVRIGRGH